jgi:hypothetical protein
MLVLGGVRSAAGRRTVVVAIPLRLFELFFYLSQSLVGLPHLLSTSDEQRLRYPFTSKTSLG